MSQTLYTHWNGGRPYRVVITGNQAAVSTESDDGQQDYDNNPVLITFFERIWIGGDDEVDENDEHDFGFGNSVLLQLDAQTYLWIANLILTFEAFSPIVDFESPVFGSDMPYAWARDEEGSTYVLLEYVVLPKNAFAVHVNPHSWFYDHRNITKDLCRIPPVEARYPNSLDIVEAHIGRERFTLSWHAAPRNHYDWMIGKKKKKFVIKNSKGEQRELSCDEYVELMDDWMHARQWRKIVVKDVTFPPGYKWLSNAWAFEP